MDKIIKNLEKDIYCRIKRSKKHGVGVVAIRDIPKNTNPFKILKKTKSIDIPKNKLTKVPKEVIKMCDDFFGSPDDDFYTIPNSGLNSINVSYFMNHSNKPNIDIFYQKNNVAIFKTNKVVKKGTKLTINYDNF